VVEVLVDHKLVLEVEVVGVGAEEVAEEVAVVEVLVDHKLVLEVEVVGVEAVEEVAALGLGVLEVADRTALPGLVVAVRVRRFQQRGPGILPVHPTREAPAQQTLAPKVARAQQT
jgi:hypothetical protein